MSQEEYRKGYHAGYNAGRIAERKEIQSCAMENPFITTMTEEWWYECLKGGGLIEKPKEEPFKEGFENPIECKELAHFFANWLYYKGLGDNYVSSPEKAIGKMLSRRNPYAVIKLRDYSLKTNNSYETKYYVRDVLAAREEFHETATPRTRNKKA